jgi:hypothetical protein
MPGIVLDGIKVLVLMVETMLVSMFINATSVVLHIKLLTANNLVERNHWSVLLSTFRPPTLQYIFPLFFHTYIAFYSKLPPPKDATFF